MSITALTVNIHKGFGPFNRRFVLPELREAVRAVGADVVFLQEVVGAHEAHADRVEGWPEEPHYEFLADQMWPQHAYGRNAVYPNGHHGNAILSKFPIVSFTNHDVSVGGIERRGLLHCVLELPRQGERLHAICAHLGLRETHRQEQLRLLCALIERDVPEGEALIVAGDFNDWRQRADGILVKVGLKEVFSETYGELARTFPARLPLLRLDRIYTRRARARKAIVLPRRPWSHLSDHAPLAAEILI